MEKKMSSVTQRVREIKQPHGGYLPVKGFEVINLNDDLILNEVENIHSSIIGLAVDYLTRFKMENNVVKAFDISLKGAKLIGMYNKALELIDNINDLDDISITNACKMCGFDVCYRASLMGYRPIEEINPDVNTIENIRIMVKRSLSFFEIYGPVLHNEPTFEGGYTDIVNAGDGDYITADTLWDFKVSTSKITSKHTLQILMYYIMGLHSVHGYYKNIKKLGFYNPRMNVVYLCKVSSISSEIIKEVEDNVICYNFKKITMSKKQDNDDLTIADICTITGFQKNVIYKDIRSGILYAHKKSNKYYVPKPEVVRYIEMKKRQKKILVIAGLVGVIISIIFYIIIFISIGV